MQQRITNTTLLFITDIMMEIIVDGIKVVDRITISPSRTRSQGFFNATITYHVDADATLYLDDDRRYARIMACKNGLSDRMSAGQINAHAAVYGLTPTTEMTANDRELDAALNIQEGGCL